MCVLWTTVHTSTTPQSLVCVDFRRGMWKTSRAGSRYTCRFPSAGPARIRDPCPRGARFFICVSTFRVVHRILWFVGRGARDAGVGALL